MSVPNDPNPNPNPNPNPEPEPNPPEIDPKIAELMKDPDAIQALLDKKRGANAEAKKYREQLEKLQKDRADADKKKLEEEGKYKELNDKLTQENADLSSKFSRRAKLAALRFEASQAGILDPDDVLLVDLEKVELDDDMEAKNAKEIIEQFKKDKPHKFGEPGDDIHPAPPGHKANLKDKVLGGRKYADMSPQERIRHGMKAKK